MTQSDSFREFGMQGRVQSLLAYASLAQSTLTGFWRRSVICLRGNFLFSYLTQILRLNSEINT